VSAEFRHEPVLARDVVAVLRPAPGRLFLDGTLGGGGHAGLLLEAGARVIGLD
jgi:16S rRNA (cytosine1402-N4)-methyltransferase